MADNNNSSSFLEQLREIRLEDINELDWENAGSWPILGKFFLCLLLMSAVAFGGYWFLIKDSMSLLQASERQELTLKKDYEAKAFRVANIDEYKNQMQQMEENFGSMLKQLPRDTEVPGLIDDISASALSAGLKLNAIDPRGLVNTEFYRELPIDIKVSGDYHELGAFVSAVASLPRIVTLHDFAIDSGKGGSLNMSILAKTYQYNDAGN